MVVQNVMSKRVGARRGMKFGYRPISFCIKTLRLQYKQLRLSSAIHFQIAPY